MPPVDGVRLATAAAGIRYPGRTDVLLALLDEGTTVAGVFTRSKCPSAAVDWCREQTQQRAGARARGQFRQCQCLYGKVRPQAATELTAEIAAQAAGCKPADVFLASTGVIGEPLDATKFDGVMEGLAAGAQAGDWLDAAKAIMTTDTFPKVAAAMAASDGTAVTINGIAKGAGMIAPDMATMLSFVFTDAPIAAPRAARRCCATASTTPSTP